MNPEQELKQHVTSILRTGKKVRSLRGLDAELSHLLRLPFPAEDAESVTYIQEPPYPRQLQLVSTSGEKLGRFGDLDATNLMKWTKVRATDQTTGQIVCFWTLELYTFSDGWRIDDAKRLFHVAMLNDQGGILLDQEVAIKDVNISCGDNGKRHFATANFRPDLYDIDDGAELYYPGGTLFRHC